MATRRVTPSAMIRGLHARLDRALSAVERLSSSEAIHDARVAARRLEAALALIPVPGPGAKLSKRVRKIRRRLGESRDWEVMLELMDGHDQRAWMVSSLEASRRNAARGMPRQRAKLGRMMTHTGAAPVPNASQLRQHLAHAGFGVLHAAQALQQHRSWPALHKLRIHLKRFRYQLEAAQRLGLVGAEPGAMEALKQAQEVLGHALDLHVVRVLARRHHLRPAVEHTDPSRFARQVERWFGSTRNMPRGRRRPGPARSHPGA